MAVTKTITLDERTARIAAKIPNFSKWVRLNLLDLEHKQTGQIEEFHLAEPQARKWGPDKDKCNPHLTTGLCITIDRDRLSHEHSDIGRNLYA